MKKLVATLLAVLLCFSVFIPAAAEKSGEYRYELLSDGTARILNYSGNVPVLNIPDSLDGHPVSELGNWSFGGIDDLLIVNIPEGVRLVDWSSFEDCTNLLQVNLPSTLVSIGEAAFEDCINLTAVRLPEGLVSVAVDAFEDCEAFRNIIIPETATELNAGMFNGTGNFRIWCIDGSVALQYAKDHKIPYYIMEKGEIIYGDCNTDHKPRANDLLILRKYLAGYTLYIDTQAADCYADGTINAKDVLLLRQYLADWDVTLGRQA